MGKAVVRMHGGLFQDMEVLVEERERQHLRRRRESTHLKEMNEVRLGMPCMRQPASLCWRL
eukprot:8968231-Pyramimonas_sp.AAC.1